MDYHHHQWSAKDNNSCSTLNQVCGDRIVNCDCDYPELGLIHRKHKVSIAQQNAGFLWKCPLPSTACSVLNFQLDTLSYYYRCHNSSTLFAKLVLQIGVPRVWLWDKVTKARRSLLFSLLCEILFQSHFCVNAALVKVIKSSHLAIFNIHQSSILCCCCSVSVSILS